MRSGVERERGELGVWPLQQRRPNALPVLREGARWGMPQALRECACELHTAAVRGDRAERGRAVECLGVKEALHER